MCAWFHVSSFTKNTYIHPTFSSVQSLIRVRVFVTPWTAAHQASLSITNSRSLLKLMSIESVTPSNHLILSRPLPLLPSIFPSIRVFSNESVLIRWPKYWSFSFSISPSNEHPGLISFRMHWFDLLAVQRTLKSLLQHHSSKASILWHSTFSLDISYLDFFASWGLWWLKTNKQTKLLLYRLSGLFSLLEWKQYYPATVFILNGSRI